MRESLNKAANKYAENWEEIHPDIDFDNITPIEVSEMDFKAGAEWMQEQRIYSEEDMIAYHEWAENSSDAYDFWNTNKRHPTMDNSYMEYMREKKKELFQIWKSKFKKQ